MERFLPLAYERLKGKGGRAPLFPIFTEITYACSNGTSCARWWIHLHSTRNI